MGKLKVGYVGVAFGTYFAEEYDQYNRAITGLEKLAQELDFELHPIRYGLLEGHQVESAAAELEAAKIDFLLIEAAACGDGEAVVRLSRVAPRMGIWATPDPFQEGEIKIHGLVVVNQYASILKRYLRHNDVPFKWFMTMSKRSVSRSALASRFALLKRLKRSLKPVSAGLEGFLRLFRHGV